MTYNGHASTPRGRSWESEDRCPFCGKYCRAVIYTELGSSDATITHQCEHAELVRGEWEFYSDEDLA